MPIRAIRGSLLSPIRNFRPRTLPRQSALQKHNPALKHRKPISLPNLVPIRQRHSPAMSSNSNEFQLIYWPGLPGRGEFVRLALEEAGIAYKDTARQADCIAAMQAQLGGTRWSPHPLSLVHNTHHPIDIQLYYDDQKTEALRYTRAYVGSRLPKYLAYFESVLAAPTSGEGPWLYGGKLTYADLVLYHGLDGVQFSFPKAMVKAKESGKYGKVFALYEAVKERPNIKAYLASERRQKYSNGIYRYYAELDIV
ncbi:hypothetical protein MAPG_04752 [Magnaporthiopsis poae ATCC 64411]|uniref:GST C-terminal domain-containing protein n=1 Tax=Magnaporthiopsis poae (strain ATCC 64411 / 73-15) TaxID=644358 RepID=A0A0C4DXJ8_MAGP6|nr:hypothetical protein MAPG_04752 [Magnaporthiopsis poae ATCC 64411]